MGGGAEGGRDGHTWTAQRFAPAWWLPGAHAQTLAGKFLRPAPDGMLENERIETPDGDFLDITWMPETDPAQPLVLVLHGLEGHTRKGYMVQTYLALADRGIRAVGLNFRGCSGEMNRKPRFYHSGETEDVGFVFDLLRKRFPTRPLMAIGFSLGGNILLQLTLDPRRPLLHLVGDDHDGPLLAEPAGRGGADALTGAGDDAHLALQPAGARRSRVQRGGHGLSSRARPAPIIYHR